MPLDRYGVLLGTLREHHRDQPDTQGRWYHVNLRIEAPVDVDSKQSATGVQWKVLTVGPQSLSNVVGLAPGYSFATRR